jgi:putative PIN family toxin of toxin-antitoxin system
MKVEATRAARVVVDSNVWISAALSRDGSPARVMRRVLECGIPVFSAATFAELEARFWRPKFDRYLSMDLRRRILHDASAVAYWVDVPNAIQVQHWSRDVDDDKFIHAALAAQAGWLVSGDQDLLTVAAIEGLQIASPADALADARFCPCA